MTLERLRIFVAVAERQHVTAAARALNLTQSAVSNAIAALEAEHDVHLFDRVGRGVVLNQTGLAFLPEAKAVLARAAAAEAALADMSALRRGRLTIFASQTIASAWLPRRLAAFHAAHPGVELDVAIGNTREVAEGVLSGAAELGLVEGEIDQPLLDQTVVGSDRLAVLVTPDHPWAGLRRLETQTLATQAWVLREAGSGTRSTLEAALRNAGVDPAALSIAMTLPSNEAVLAAAEAGAGATALSESVAYASVAAGRLVTAAFSLPERPFRLLRHSERYRSRAGDAFVAAMG
ncbi:LysR family transcriptional regulator [Brevundimonas intermedia]|uniref:LysR family transcriptional regulator n=1 Tax=Brevundimonas intermedia TaxID=74315 RepID=A0ABQ5T833_9CAUL|nr:LysR family transcriptional regulator [Brevundimonas intermedia]GLK48558.1 LysR family transcriptional regulator [Brevundimonas intermedia]